MARWLVFRADFQKAAGDMTERESDPFKYKSEYIMCVCSFNICSSNHVKKIHNVHTVSSYIQNYLNIYITHTQDTLSIRSIKIHVQRILSQSCSDCF